MWAPKQTTADGIHRELATRIEAVPQTWERFTKKLPMKAASQKYGWLGDLPRPRVMEGGRHFQGIGEYTYDVENRAHELSFIIDREKYEDDQMGLIRDRIAQVADAWGTYKQWLFIQMLIDGATAGHVAHDGLTFFHGARTLGDSGVIDNSLTADAATGTIPTPAEFLDAIQACKTAMARFRSDKGLPTITRSAIRALSVLIPPIYERAAAEALTSTTISQGYGTADNVYGRGLATPEVESLLTADNKMYLLATGDETRKPILYAEHEEAKLEIVIDIDPVNVAKNDGVLVMLRERFDFAYGDFYTAIEFTFG